MSDDKIAEIRARHLREDRWCYSPSPQMHADRATLLAEVEQQARHIEELREKIDAEKSCACSFDAPGDVCAAHSPSLTRALAEVDRQRAENERLRAALRRIGMPLNKVAFCRDGHEIAVLLARAALEDEP